MKILDEKGLSGIVKRMLELIFLGGAAIVIGLPFLLKWYIGHFFGTNEQYEFLLPFLYVNGALALWIVFEVRRIFITLNKRNPFARSNVTSLKRIAAASFLISAAYVVKIIFFNTFMTIILAMVFIIAGLFSIVLAEVFHQAILVKEENDLTI